MCIRDSIVCNSAKESKKNESSLFEEVEASPSPLRGEGRGEGDSCGICPACIKADKLVHPDIHFSYPIITRKPGDKPKSTDYINEWREFISGFPYGNVYDWLCLLYTSDAADDLLCVDLGGRRIIKKKKK